MIPTACICYRCGCWVGEVSDEFIKVYRKKGSIPGIDYELEDVYCEDCQRQDRINDERRYILYYLYKNK